MLRSPEQRGEKQTKLVVLGQACQGSAVAGGKSPPQQLGIMEGSSRPCPQGSWDQL